MRPHVRVFLFSQLMIMTSFYNIENISFLLIEQVDFDFDFHFIVKKNYSQRSGEIIES